MMQDSLQTNPKLIPELHEFYGVPLDFELGGIANVEFLAFLLIFSSLGTPFLSDACGQSAFQVVTCIKRR